MIELFSNIIIQKIEQASKLYHRLVLVVAPQGSGKTLALRNVQQNLEVPFVNVNLEISRQLLDLTARQQALQISRIMEDVLRKAETEVVILDNIEILFEISLKQDPLRLLQGLSRNRTIVASWNGKIKNNHLTYATPDHQEYRRYPSRDLLVVTPQSEP
jgi:ABC-type uncharacterized transport system ATPase component